MPRRSFLFLDRLFESKSESEVEVDGPAGSPACQTAQRRRRLQVRPDRQWQARPVPSARSEDTEHAATAAALHRRVSGSHGGYDATSDGSP